MPVPTVVTLAGAAGTIATDETGVYRAGVWSTSGIAWTRATVTSPWTHGRILRAATKDVKSVTGEIIVFSSLSDDPSVHDARLASLLAIVDSFAWTLSISAGSLVRQYACEPGDYAPVSDESLMSNDTDRWTTVAFTIPVNPLPSSGAW